MSIFETNFGPKEGNSIYPVIFYYQFLLSQVLLEPIQLLRKESSHWLSQGNARNKVFSADFLAFIIF